MIAAYEVQAAESPAPRADGLRRSPRIDEEAPASGTCTGPRRWSTPGGRRRPWRRSRADPRRRARRRPSRPTLVALPQRARGTGASAPTAELVQLSVPLRAGPAAARQLSAPGNRGNARSSAGRESSTSRGGAPPDRGVDRILQAGGVDHPRPARRSAPPHGRCAAVVRHGHHECGPCHVRDRPASGRVS